jgi:molybdopterin molybdotransferase
VITQNEAYEIMMARARTLDSEQVGLSESLGRVLAEDVRSDIDMPPFIKSAMDGYACRRVDLKNDLNVVEVIKAGQAPEKAIGPGQCSKIMTGSMVPEGADCVFMVEHTEKVGADTVRFSADSTRDNICLKGEDIQLGEVVLNAGALLEPQHVALLASVGCVTPQVVRRPRVGIISTGDELVEPDIKPDLSQIRTSNSHQLTAQVRRTGAIPTYYGIARDTVESLDATLKNAISESDVVLLSGGVSMGDLDLVPGIMKANGLEILFDEIAVQPGKPTTFAVSDDIYCVGLPGNPVAAFTQFEHLVKPLVYRLMGHDHRPIDFRLPMARRHTRKRAVRESWFLATVTADGAVMPCEFHGSAHVSALCEADALATMPAGVASLDEGALVTVRTL